MEAHRERIPKAVGEDPRQYASAELLRAYVVVRRPRPAETATELGFKCAVCGNSHLHGTRRHSEKELEAVDKRVNREKRPIAVRLR